MTSSEVSRPPFRSAPDRKVFWLGVASLLLASLSYVLAWNGGLWAMPFWSALAIATWTAAWREGGSRWVKAGLAMSGIALLTGGYALVSSGGVQAALRADSSSYRPGAAVEVQLKAGLRSVGYNLCFAFATLEGVDGDGAEALDVNLGPPGTACTGEMWGLPPLFGATGAAYLPRDLRSGEYRLSYEIEVGGERRAVTTSPFSVRT